jgi:hypothetical protein
MNHSHKKRDQDAELQAINDVLRFEIVNKIMRPLNEGMALFAEYDAMSTYRTPIISLPMRWLLFAFHPPPTDIIEISLAQILRRARLNDGAMRRKAVLLLRAMNCDKGGYLAGYLMVKAMWRHAKRACDLFCDSDFFLMFMKRYFYADWAFSERVLSDYKEDESAFEAICDYFENRVTSFFTLDLAAESERYLQSETPHMDAVERRAPDYPPLNADPARYERGKHLAQKIVEALSDDEFGIGQLNLMTQRHLLWLGGSSVRFKKDSNGISAKLGNRILVDGIKDHLAKRTKNGMVNVFISMEDLYAAFVITVGPFVIATKFLGDVPERRRKEFAVYIGERKRVIDVEAETHEYFEHVLKRVENLDEFRAQMPDVVNEIYARPVMSAIEDKDLRKECYANLKDRGLLPLVNGDSDLLKMAAALSLASAMQIKVADLGHWFRDLPMSVDRALARLKDCSEKYGFPLIWEENGFLESQI